MILSPTNLVGFEHYFANDTSGTQQVGSAYGFDASHNSYSHALLWTGSAASAVDLHPTNLPGIVSSEALATDGLQQVGWGAPYLTPGHAFLWSGTANSVVDLNPPGFYGSDAYGVRNGKQVGYALATDGTDYHQHALLWTGTAASAVDLHLLLPSSFESSRAYSIDDAGDVFGVAFNSSGIHAIEWIPGIAGDYNQNGIVDAADYVAWRKNGGITTTYDTWRANFGHTAGGGAALPSAEPLSAAVPEPAGLWLMAFCGMLAMRWKKIRARVRSYPLPISSTT